jgi:hypothetical protein
VNRRLADRAGSPTSTPRRAGEGRIVRHHAVDQGRYQISNNADADADRRATKGLTAIDQSAPVVVRHLQIGITVQAVQTQSP